MADKPKLSLKYLSEDFPVSEPYNENWYLAELVIVERNFSGVMAADTRRHFEARLLWSESSLYVRFEANQAEPLIISAERNIETKTLGLWERDVCEIFIAPDQNEPRRYFEFEIAPTGEWLDLAIDLTSGERVSDLEYDSGIETFARIEKNRVVMAIKIPWEAFGKKPAAGDVWLGNIFRCVGSEPDRGYLAWRPTLTKTPNFHVPEKFGEFVFIK